MRGTPNRTYREQNRVPELARMPTYGVQNPKRHGYTLRERQDTPQKHSRELRKSPEPVVRRKTQMYRKDQHPVEKTAMNTRDRSVYNMDRSDLLTQNRFSVLNSHHQEEVFWGNHMKGRHKDIGAGRGTPGKRERSIEDGELEEEFTYKRGKKVRE
ncbi:Hypothetical predicted protein [Pelobates cultripes]|uniref:Uncharacterized protein n=1 Tax=Pelobates cultripes TaxID=61616 RepID=A0AAD1SJX9_PELCU|nr:Hypothetical predicted protein [Pelobates cultripes]